MHTHIGSSRLVRRLCAWAPAGALAPRQDVAQRLAEWLSVPDAIALHGAHQAIRAVPAGRVARRSDRGDVDTLDAELQRVRDTLAAGILASAAAPATHGARRGRSVAASAPAPDEADPGFGPWRLRCQDLQRQMDLRIEALRAHARQVLAGTTGPLARLALMDAAMEHMLAGRGQKLLGTLPDFLERRFEQLRKQHGRMEATPLHGQSADPPAWQAAFRREWQEVLLAELELRLQPVCGLVEACGQAIKRQA